MTKTKKPNKKKPASSSQKEVKPKASGQQSTAKLTWLPKKHLKFSFLSLGLWSKKPMTKLSKK